MRPGSDEERTRRRIRGALLGLAAGDALGTTLEFRVRGEFEPLTDMIGGGAFGLRPGQWTDDTSMALCLCESLLEQGFDPVDQLRRYVRWWREGHLSSTGTCFDIGTTVRAALARFERTGEPWCGSEDPRAAGNGSLMRLAPVPIFFRGDPRRAVEASGASSRTTHAAREAIDACRYFGGLIVGALAGATKDDLVGGRHAPAAGLWDEEPLAPAIDAIARGSFREKTADEMRGSGYVVHSLEAALWAFHRSHDFASGALFAVNLGEDADTTGAIYGQLAGAYYGEASIPRAWREKLAHRTRLEDFADRLAESPGA